MAEKTPTYIKVQFYGFLILLSIPVIALFLKKNFFEQNILFILFLFVYPLLLAIPHSFYRQDRSLKFALKVNLILSILIVGVFILYGAIGSKLRLLGSGDDAMGTWLASIICGFLAPVTLFFVNIPLLFIHKSIIKYLSKQKP